MCLMALSNGSFLPIWTIFIGICHGLAGGDASDSEARYSRYGKLHDSDRLVPTKNLPIIVWWSKYINMYDHPHEISCGEVSCYTTRNRTWVTSDQTRSILIYGTELDPDDMPFPKLPQHQWALFHEESPMNNYMLVHGPIGRLFNHTATFSRESDFPLTTQHIPSISYLLDRKPLLLSTKNKLQKTQSLSPILYVQSHCDVASDRDRYVKELMKFIAVDSYGGCLNNKKLTPDLQDPVKSMGSRKFLNFIARYKFHIAFENAICNDYITEKLFRVLHVGSVPIYRGSPTAKDWAPNNYSVIMADDFDSPAQLAKYINTVNEDDSLYEQYLVYKERGIDNSLLEKEINNRPWGHRDNDHNFISAFECFVCQSISNIEYSTRGTDRNIVAAVPTKDKPNHLRCPQPYTSVGDVTDLTSKDSWRRMDWIEDYWTGYDKARAVRRMVEVNETDPSKFNMYLHDIFKRSVRS